MTTTLPERDWKYLRSMEAALLARLCERINKEARDILDGTYENEHKKYLALFKHFQDSDQIVADCFNDWRRSNLRLKLLFLRKHKLLNDGHIEKLSDETRAMLASCNM